MSQERIEYAAVELYYASGRYRVMPYSEARNDCEADAARILAKADVSMFSDEAIERAARDLARHRWQDAINVWDSLGQDAKDGFRDQARIVVAALRGES